MKSLKSALQGYKQKKIKSDPNIEGIAILAQEYNKIYNVIPDSKKYEQNYVMYRVKLPSVKITKETRDDILSLMDKGKSYVQVGEYTIMLNSIASIDPLPIKKKPKKYKIENGIAKEI